MQEYKLSLLGLEVSFRAGVDAARVEKARLLVEERFEKLRLHGGRTSKELLLTFLVLGLADDLLQAQEELGSTQERLDAMLAKIEELI